MEVRKVSSCLYSNVSSVLSKVCVLLKELPVGRFQSTLFESVQASQAGQKCMCKLGYLV